MDVGALIDIYIFTTLAIDLPISTLMHSPLGLVACIRFLGCANSLPYTLAHV